MTEPWTIARVLEWTRKDFAARGRSSPLLDAQLLLGHALGLKRVELYTRFDQPLSGDELARVRALVERRRRGEPVAYLLGAREFYGRSFAVDARVLVPRPETEGVVTAALAALDRRAGVAPAALHEEGVDREGALDEAPARPARGPKPRGAGQRVLDVGTGSGALAVTLAAERPELHVDAVELSPDAAVVARANAEKLGVSARVRVLEGDLFGPVAGARYDAVVSNPPYISEAALAGLMEDVRDHEPRMALVGGPDGLEVVARLVREAPAYLLPGAGLFVELGHDQGERAAELAREAGLRDVRVERDFSGIPRVLVGFAAS